MWHTVFTTHHSNNTYVRKKNGMIVHGMRYTGPRSIKFKFKVIYFNCAYSDTTHQNLGQQKGIHNTPRPLGSHARFHTS
jgi:hypothetical protein